MTYKEIIDKALKLVPKLENHPTYCPKKLLPDDHITCIELNYPLLPDKYLLYFILHPFFTPSTGTIFTARLKHTDHVEYIPNPNISYREHRLLTSIQNILKEEDKQLMSELTGLMQGIFTKYEEVDRNTSAYIRGIPEVRSYICTDFTVDDFDLPIIIRKTRLSYKDIDNIRKDILLIAALNLVVTGVTDV